MESENERIEERNLETRRLSTQDAKQKISSSKCIAQLLPQPVV